MLSWLAKAILTRNMARLREGDYGPLLRLDAKDIRFRFPGDSSWATEIDNRDDLERWAEWGESERLVVNIANIYSELAGEHEPQNPLIAFEQMAALARPA